MAESTVRVLVVEGNAGHVHLMRLALREHSAEFELTWAGGLAGALTFLAQGRFDVILLDPTLVDAPGVEAIRRLREAAPDVPLLLLASTADVPLCLAAMEQGAHDYLFKDVLTTRLLARTIRDAVERSRPNPPTGAQFLDPITGLANREGLLAHANHIWRSPTRLRRGATLLYLSLDGLVALCSGGDPTAGARDLRDIADLLRDTFRGSDLRARLDGPEFIVLALGAPEPTAPILITRLEEALQACNAHDERPQPLVLHLGLAHYDADRPCSFEEMLTAARNRLSSQHLGSERPVGSLLVTAGHEK